MARVAGPSLAELRRRDDAYATRVVDAVRDTLRTVAAGVSDRPTADDVATVPTVWERHVDALLEGVADAFTLGVDAVQIGVARLLVGLRAAGDVGRQPEDAPATISAVPRVANPEVEVYLLDARNRLVGLGNEVWEHVRGAVIDGALDGDSTAGIRDRIVGATDLAAPRAEVIARTEINGAANGGALAEMRAIGLPATKEWLATGGGRTRETHLEADGQKVDLADVFHVGGAAMDRPLDPSGPPGEVINCRCSMGFDVQEDSLTSLLDTSDLAESASLVAAADVQTGAMIALVPADPGALALDVDGAEPADELHLTLLYLGDAARYDAEMRAALVAAITECAARCGPVHAIAFGAALWNPDAPDPAWVWSVGDDPDAPDVPDVDCELDDVHEAVVADAVECCGELVPEQHEPWVAHVCAAYAPATADLLPALLDRVGSVTFDRVRVAFAEDVTDVPLTAGGATLPPADRPPPEEHMTESGTAVADGAVDLGGKPSSGTKKDKRLKENDTALDDGVELADVPAIPTAPDAGDALDDGVADDAAADDTTAPWTGVLTVEGVTTGDGREFAPNSLTWQDPPLPLRWNKEDSHGGIAQTVAVNVGRIDRIWREGNKIMGSGVLNLAETDGQRAYDLVKGEFLKGVSIDADDVTDADIEYVWPADDSAEVDEGLDIISILFGNPEKTIFHAGRIRAATLCDIPAFVEAFIVIDDAAEPALLASLALAGVETPFAAVGSHKTATSDGAWDGPANEKRLPSPMPESTARKAYAYVDTSKVADGELPKTAGRFIHHEVGADGTPGAANLTACSTGIGVIHGGRGGTTLPEADQRGVYNHLAKHLRDAGREPPPFDVDSLVAHALPNAWRPPRDWFEDPKLNVVVPLTITDQGRIYGHAAQWGSCHVGVRDECVTPPRETDHPYFMTGEVICDDGSVVPVGQITIGTGHAAQYLGASTAVEHYDNTGCAVADITVGNDRYGIWMAGAIRADAPASQVQALRAAGQVSGDWRRIGGQLRLVGLLAVNVPGFPIPRMRVRVASGQTQSVLAAGQLTVSRGPSESDLNERALRLLKRSIADRVANIGGR